MEEGARPVSGPAGRPGRTISSYFLLGGAGCLLLAAIVHATQYAAATLVLRNSVLSPWFQESFRALWLGHSLQFLVIAAILAVAALKPGSVSRSVTMLCGLLPLLSGLLLALYNKSLFSTVVFLAAAILIVAGASLAPSLSSPPRPAR